MRLQLTIQRNRLEPVNVLWTVSDAQLQGSAQTIHKLLSDVDEKFPLEADDWGLEDYTVCLNGFECLHYSKVGEVLRDGDHVVIRPLESVDIRSRTISGRQQISAAGIQLLDGVPFGRPFLRSLDRPRIHIPPRKRRRLTADEHGQVIPLAKGEGTEVSLSDVDRDEQQLLLLNGGEASLLEQNGVEPVHSTPREKALRVRFSGSHKNAKDSSEDEVLSDVDDEDEEDDDDFEPENAAITSDEDATSEDSMHDTSSEVSTDESVSESSSVSSDSSEEASSSLGSPTSARSSPHIHQDTTKASNIRLEARGKPALESDLSSIPNQVNNKATTNTSQSSFIGIPHEGKQRTKVRNRRRKESKLLHRLKEQGQLPDNATIQDARDLLGQNQSLQPVMVTTTAETSLSPKLAAASSPSAAKGTNVPEKPPNAIPSNNTLAKADTDFEARRAKLLQDIADGTLTVGKDFHDERANPRKRERQSTQNAHVPEIIETPISQKRARLDVDASRRLIFGNLGQRAPKTRVEAELLKQKLSGASTISPKTGPSTTQPVPAQIERAPGFWSSKITLKAVECVDEGIILSTPPFPFVQRWDPQQKLVKQKPAKAKKRKRAGRQQYQEGYEEQDVDGDDSWYDPTLDGAQFEDTYHTENENPGFEDAVEQDLPSTAVQAPVHHIDNQSMNDECATTAGSVVEHDMPPLPSNYRLSLLPTVSIETLPPGTIVAFKQLEITKANRWTPTLSKFRTAQVLEDDSLDQGAVALRLATRDRKPDEAEYDEEGNRIYQGFEMPIEDDGDDYNVNDGLTILNIEEIGDCKVILAAPATKAKTINGTTTNSLSNACPNGTPKAVERTERDPSRSNGSNHTSTPILGKHVSAPSEWGGIEDDLPDEAMVASEASNR